jgi:hypothetical protein
MWYGAAMHTPLQYVRTNPMARLAAFATTLATVFGVAALAGAAVGPSPAKRKQATDEMAMHGAEPGHADMAPAGLAISEDGYRLAIADSSLQAGRAQTLRFRVLDAQGKPVHDFAEEHGSRLHLIIVRRDLTGYQHVHPRLDAGGTWSIPLTLPSAGAYRAFADFQTSGKHLTLGADLFVPGRFQPRPLPAPASVASVDGYDVELTEQSAGKLHFTVRRAGREVTDIQPYLGARGHLVALREGDLAYLHVHPEEGPTPGAGISFQAEYPSSARYRLFLQFKHEGRVHTAEYTREVTR